MTMVSCWGSHLIVDMLWRTLNKCKGPFSFTPSIRRRIDGDVSHLHLGSRPILTLKKGFSTLRPDVELNLSKVDAAVAKNILEASSTFGDPILLYAPDEPSKLEERSTESKPSDGRVMLIDGTAIIYRAYYKLLCLTFRHTLYPSYKGSRAPTPVTVVQGRQHFKAAIKVIEVSGVEADDVIGTLAANSVAAGYKVQVASPDKDFYQILSPSLRLLQISPHGSQLYD